MKRIFTMLICCVGVLALVCGCGGNKKKAQEAAEAEQAIQDSINAAEAAKKEKDLMTKMAELPEEPVFDIVTNYGTIRVKLYSKTPKHRDNFAKLALSGYYNGLLFHRVINDFMIQGGDPLTKDPSMSDRYGTGGPGYTVPAEFVPEYKHKKGALAAARRGDSANPLKESSGSQFYIVQSAANCAQLDGAYTVFGETIDGMAVIDKIAAVKVNHRDLPESPVQIKKIMYVEP